MTSMDIDKACREALSRVTKKLDRDIGDIKGDLYRGRLENDFGVVNSLLWIWKHQGAQAVINYKGVQYV